MHFGFSVLVTLLAILFLLVTAIGGNRQPVYTAAILGLVGVVGLPLRGEDGIDIVLCWLIFLAALVAVSIVRRVPSRARKPDSKPT
jgi:hypothetical protein